MNSVFTWRYSQHDFLVDGMHNIEERKEESKRVCFIRVNQRAGLSFTDIGKYGKSRLVRWEDKDFCFGHGNFEMPVM